MTDKDKDKKSTDNIFQIMDGIISQLNKTKKMFIIMILTIMIITPITFLISAAIFAPPFELDQKMERDGPHHKFIPIRMIPLIVSLVWLGIGIRQWFVLSKWTKKYDRYKELQQEIDKKLDDDEKEE
jgi:NADH:ubiquinone oxidoreductase subunit 5 (subunit L)/multisubunit Na+/H+ antiporter MnhA subunit